MSLVFCHDFKPLNIYFLPFDVGFVVVAVETLKIMEKIGANYFIVKKLAFFSSLFLLRKTLKSNVSL